MLQHRLVAESSHAAVLRALRSVEGLYDKTWRIESSPFPLIFLQVLGSDGLPVMGLKLDVQNYPHRAPSILLTDATCRKYAQQAWSKTGDTGRFGVFLNQQNQRFWFCTPGTDEYHGRYHDVEPFDRVRATEEVKPLETILRCIRFLDTAAATRELRP